MSRTKQTAKRNESGKQPNLKSIKAAQAARKAVATTGGIKKATSIQTWHRGPPRNKEIPKINRTPYQKIAFPTSCARNSIGFLAKGWWTKIYSKCY